MAGPAGPAIREVWYALHGYGQMAIPFLESLRALENPARLVVAPEALSRFYDESHGAASHRHAPVGASWMTRDDRETEIADYVAYLDDVHAAVLERGLANATARVTVMGFSQGGATAVRWTVRGRVRPARVVVWASSLPPDVDYAAPDSPLRTPALVYVAGTRDRFITPKVLEQELGRWREAGLMFRFQPFDGGHRLDDDTLRRLAADDFAPRAP